jgi:16S rRNA (adenine1518-N6/adenine1519-N6)-dimethyltransferase
MTGRDIKETLERTGVIPSRKLGQNFLCDPNLAKWIVAQLEVTPDDAVVEVGPGTGSLTEHLVGNVRHLILVEFDERLAAALANQFRDRPDVEVIHADAAQVDKRPWFKQRPLKFIGNLPYASGGAILKNLLDAPHPFDRAVVMLQKEVVDRLAAKPGGKDYGLLSLRTQANWRVQPLRTAPPEAFHPRPAIDSTIAVLTPRSTDLPPFDRRLFDSLIRRGFAQRRKQLAKQLPDGTPWKQIAASLGVSPTARAEELSLEQWIEIARASDPHPLKHLPQADGEMFDVVDEHDRVIDQKPRSEVHANRWMHRAVHVFVFNRKGDLLLQKRSMLKDAHPGVWDSSVAGHLNADEEYDQAALRELDEEMGIRPDRPPSEIASIAPSEATGWEHVRLFRVDHHGPVQFPSAEIDAVMWMSPAEIDAWTAGVPGDFANGFIECWRAWRQSAIDDSIVTPENR